LELLERVKFAVIRGNASEIGFITKNSSNTKGVDAAEADAAKDNVNLAEICAQKYGCVVAITGATDTISNGKNTILADNGVPLLKKVTGTGCMCSALIASFCGVTADYLSAAVAGVVSMGIAGEISAINNEGIGSFHLGIVDAIWKLSPEIIDKMGKIR
jgi:hydroxyethylthiazole kinase